MAAELGNIAGGVADALDVGDHLQRAAYPAQIGGHRLLAQNQIQAGVLDVLFQGIDLPVPGDHLFGQLLVALLQSQHRLLDTFGSQRSHMDEVFGEGGELCVVFYSDFQRIRSLPL